MVVLCLHAICAGAKACIFIIFIRLNHGCTVIERCSYSYSSKSFMFYYSIISLCIIALLLYSAGMYSANANAGTIHCTCVFSTFVFM